MTKPDFAKSTDELLREEIMERRRNKRNASFVIRTLAIVGIVICLGITTLVALATPGVHEVTAKFACFDTRFGGTADERMDDCERWVAAVKKDHASDYNYCVWSYGWNVSTEMSLMACFSGRQIGPETILGD